MPEIRLVEGKQRLIQRVAATSLWSADCRPISAAQFLEGLFGAPPEFFKDEDQLRAIWSPPATRRKRMEGLAEKGLGAASLAEMQQLIGAEQGELFDVLACVASACGAQTGCRRCSS